MSKKVTVNLKGMTSEEKRAYYNEHSKLGMRRMRAKRAELGIEDPSNNKERQAARRAYAKYRKQAHKMGVKIPGCVICGVPESHTDSVFSSNIVGHHTRGYDQEHWLDVDHLCTKCHSIYHVLERKTGKAPEYADVYEIVKRDRGEDVDNV